jgi:drug/metabolite transporter (DMT)-like permease
VRTADAASSGASDAAEDLFEVAVTNPYLEPVARTWARVAGIALLVAGAGLTVVLGWQFLDLVQHENVRRAFTSSSLIFGLILLVLCGICWQAGYRLVFGRPDRSGTLFSRPAWLAIGTGLIVITMLMAVVIVESRRTSVLDVQVILFLGGIGVWCVVLALRRR